jgi:carbon-monoxide dehydrogenase medium subunit
MYAFTYHRADSLKEAASLLAKADDAKLLAGGQTLLPTLKQRLASPANVIDLGGLTELRTIEVTGRTISIGAMTRHADVANSSQIKEVLPGLAALAGNIGDPHVRHRGTIGGSLANNDPAADYPAAVLALNGTIVTNKRKLSADEFFQGMFSTALEEDEIITRVMLPIAGKFAYAKFPNPASRYAMVGVAVAKKAGEARVAVTGAGAGGVFRWTAAEAALNEKFSSKSLEGMQADPAEMNSDIHGSAEYRAHLVGVMARRAVDAAKGK